MNILKKYLLIWWVITTGSGIYFLFTKNPSLTKEASLNYNVVVICFLVCSVFFLLCYAGKEIQIFEPLSVVSLVWYFMFIYYPLLDINEGTTTFFVQSFTDGICKGSVVAAVGFVAFLFGYYWRSYYHYRKSDQICLEDSAAGKQKAFYIALVLWGVGLIANLVYIMSSGKSLAYIFTLGQGGNMNTELASSSPLGFVGMFGFLMIGSWFYIKEYGNNRLLSMITYFITLILFITRGFRFILVVILVAPIIFHYEKQKKKPNIILLAGMLILLLAMITIVGYFRGDIRSGVSTVDMSGINFNTVQRSLYDNFGQYRAFFIMVEQIPEHYPHTYGVKTFINPIIMLIPRILWSGKTFLGSASANFLSLEAQIAGSACPNIAEFYMDFGGIGSAIAMYFFGRILGWTKKWINGDIISIHTIIAYCVAVPLTMQLVIRGYMASNFNLVIFSLLPMWICNCFARKRRR